jgi:hypothetical protein
MREYSDAGAGAGQAGQVDQLEKEPYPISPGHPDATVIAINTLKAFWFVSCCLTHREDVIYSMPDSGGLLSEHMSSDFWSCPICAPGDVVIVERREDGDRRYLLQRPAPTSG